jgi:hypothetical protein
MPLPLPVLPWHGEQNTLKRSRPRAITSAVTGIGNDVARRPSTLPSFRCTSSRSIPRATVLATSVRDAAPLAKNGDACSGS